MTYKHPNQLKAFNKNNQIWFGMLRCWLHNQSFHNTVYKSVLPPAADTPYFSGPCCETIANSEQLMEWKCFGAADSPWVTYDPFQQLNHASCQLWRQKTWTSFLYYRLPLRKFVAHTLWCFFSNICSDVSSMECLHCIRSWGHHTTSLDCTLDLHYHQTQPMLTNFISFINPIITGCFFLEK